jgi:hypothetical protein
MKTISWANTLAYSSRGSFVAKEEKSYITLVLKQPYFKYLNENENNFNGQTL